MILRPPAVALAIVMALAAVTGCGTDSGGSGSSAAQSPTDAASPAGDVAVPAPWRATGPEPVSALSAPTPPRQPVLEPRYEAMLVADHCTDRDIAAPPATDVALTILDRSHALPSGYVPPDLVPASEAGMRGASGDRLVRSIVIEDLAAMRRAWEAAHLTITVESAYRSYASQAATFDLWVTRLGMPGAVLRTARPGHSEHQLGTAIDVTSPGWLGRVGDWALSAEGAWMAAHGWEYGWVMSYPAGSQEATCYGYEPWHYRWIGRENAAAHRDSGLPLREFLERFVSG